VTIDGIVDRATLFARALGFVFLVYFGPVLIRDVLALVVGGGGISALFGGSDSDLRITAILTAGTVALSLFFTILYGRLGRGANQPRALVRRDASWWREWTAGVAFAGVSSGALFGLLVATGEIRVSGFSEHVRVTGFLYAIAILLLEAFREELGFRGAAQRDLSGATAFPFAAVFLAGSFALIHRSNPAFTPTGLLGVFLAGLFLAGVAHRRGDVALASGWHGGWNVFVGLIWSTPLSGYRLENSLLATEPARDSSAAGGAFGFEGSWPGIALFVLLGMLSWRARSVPRAAATPEPTTGDDA